MPVIPKIIHFCWPGDDAIPVELLANAARWQTLMPDWEQRLWRGQNPIDWELVSGGAFARQTNLGARSDILRAEVLYRFGGLYVDGDIEPVATLGDLLTGDLVCARSSGQPLNAFMACAMGHPAMGRLLAMYRPLAEVELGWSSVIQRTGSIAVGRSFRGAAVTWLEAAELPVVHRSMCRWKRGAAFDGGQAGNEVSVCVGCGDRTNVAEVKASPAGIQAMLTG